MIPSVRSLAASLVLLIAASSGGAAPDEASFVRSYFATFSARDTARLAEFYTPEATFDDPSFGLALKGSKAIQDLLTKVLAKYQTLDFSILHVTSAGDTRVVEGVMDAMLAGRTVHVHFVSVFSYAGDRIAAQRDLYDVLHFYSQLGVTPPEFRPAPKQN